MKAERKSARITIKNSSRAEYDQIIFAANLTPSQENILNLHFRQELSLCNIAEILSCSEGYVRKKLTAAYDKIAKTINF